MVGDGHDSFELTPDHQALFDRFHKRTVLTFGFVGSENVYQSHVVQLALQVRILLELPSNLYLS